MTAFIVLIVVGSIIILLSDVLAKWMFILGGDRNIASVSSIRMFAMRIAWWGTGSVIVATRALQLAEILRPLQWWKLLIR
jgi:hypothetical protein